MEMRIFNGKLKPCASKYLMKYREKPTIYFRRTQVFCFAVSIDLSDSIVQHAEGAVREVTVSRGQCLHAHLNSTALFRVLRKGNKSCTF